MTHSTNYPERSALRARAREILAALSPAPRLDLRGKNALITGGARGLGLEIARVLVRKGAHVALVARDPDEIARAVAALEGTRSRVIGEPCDLREPAQIDAMLARVTERLGPVDVLVNDAGIIQVGPLDAMTYADFDEALRVHCHAPLRTMLGVREAMRARGGGRIANVASIGGVVSVPHLLPYSVSKFALMGLSQGMHAELRKEGILVTTVAPGLMRTGSPRQALFKGDRRAEHAWFAVSDSLPLLSMSARRAAARIVTAIERGEPHLVLGLPAQVAALASGVSPTLVTRALSLASALLPRGADPEAHKGFESASKWAPSPLTALTERAATRNNER